MNLAVAARSGWSDVWANKFRSALSFSAVSVGVASLLYTLAQTRGMQLALAENIELMGPGRMTIQGARDYVSKGLSPGLTLGDAEEIRSQMPGLYMVDPHATEWDAMFQAGATLLPGLRLDAVSQEWRRRDWVYKVRGRFLLASDLAEAAKVCVLLRPAGWKKRPFWAVFMQSSPLQSLLEHEDLLDRPVSIDGRVFTVVGILTPPPHDVDPRWTSWDNPDILVPVTTYIRYLAEDDSALRKIDEIRVDTGDEKTIPYARRRISRILKRRHRGEDDFSIRDMRAETAGEMENLKQYVTIALALGLVALLAGGIGIMNVTLAVIYSRVKEIGIRRAVGAGRGDILAQFLLEAAWLGLAGGAAGLGLGLVGIHYLARWSDRDVAAVAWYHGVGLVLLGALVSAGFAFLPAWRAAGLDPVEALRSE